MDRCASVSVTLNGGFFSEKGQEMGKVGGDGFSIVLVRQRVRKEDPPIGFNEVCRFVQSLYVLRARRRCEFHFKRPSLFWKLNEQIQFQPFLRS